MKRKTLMSVRPQLELPVVMIVSVILTLVVLGTIFMLEGMIAPPLIGVALIANAVVLLTSWMNITYTRLNIYEDGIELKRPSGTFFTRWENLSHFAIRGNAEDGNRGIMLKEKITADIMDAANKTPIAQKIGFLPVGELVKIPLNPDRTIDEETLLESNFGQALLVHAPHLFQDYVSDVSKPKNRLMDDDETFREDDLLLDDEAQHSQQAN